MYVYVYVYCQKLTFPSTKCLHYHFIFGYFFDGWIHEQNTIQYNDAIIYSLFCNNTAIIECQQSRDGCRFIAQTDRNTHQMYTRTIAIEE